jgi:hypothetical protein
MYLCHGINDISDNSSMDSMLKLWSELYNNFARLSALVDNTDANIACEQLAGRILAFVDDKQPRDATFWSCLSQLLVTLVGPSFDFSSAAANGSSMFAFNLNSPMKVVPRKQKLLGNLHSVVHLEARLLRQVTERFSQQQLSPDKMTQCLISAVKVASHIFSAKLSSSVLTSVMSTLIEPLTNLFALSADKGRALT